MKIVPVYTPTDDEEYMNDKQIVYFKEKLMNMRHALLKGSNHIRKELQDTWLNHPDVFDVATSQAGLAVELNGFDRNRVQLSKIDRALFRIDTGEYGYCEITGEEIGIKRLKAQPLATLCIDVQEMLERNNQQQRLSRSQKPEDRSQ